jgi:anti-sigma factor RsiW
MSTCNTDSIRDYAFDELPQAERAAVQRHISECSDCAAELDQLRLTTAALRVLPDREPPQRIAFVSDKVFAPSKSPSQSWNFAPWLGFASAGIMAAALVFVAYHRPVEIRTVTMQAQPVDDIVKKAVAQARQEAREEDAKIFDAALKASEQKHDRQLTMVADAVSAIQQGLNNHAMESSGQ